RMDEHSEALRRPRHPAQVVAGVRKKVSCRLAPSGVGRSAVHPRCTGQREIESAATAYFALDPHSSAVCFHDAAGDEDAEATALRDLALTALAPHHRERSIVDGDTGAGVNHGEARVLLEGLGVERDRASLWRKPHGVAEQSAEHLNNALAIAQN